MPDARNSGDFSAAASTLASAAATSSCWEASARTTRSRGGALRRERLAQVLHGLGLGDRAGQGLEVAAVRLHAQRRDRQQHHHHGGQQQRDRRVLDDGAEDPSADRAGRIRRISRCRIGTRGRSTQRPSLASSAGSTVIEPSTATATTMIEPTASELNVASPRMNNPAIDADHGRTGDQDRVARGLGRDLDGVAGGVALRALLTLALEVEQRVVDTDGHADQHDHAGDGGVGVDEVRDRSKDADRGGHAGAGEQHRDAGRDQRTEREQHQDQRHRQAERLRRRQVVGDAVVDRRVEADIAGLAYVELREVGLDGLGHLTAAARRRPGHGPAGSRRGTPYRPG